MRWSRGFDRAVRGVACLGALALWTGQAAADDLKVACGSTALSSADADAHGFGSAVATDGVRAVVGAVQSGSGATAGAGLAYVFEDAGSGWAQVARLEAFDAEADDAFGWSVALDGDTIAVGAREEDAAGTDAGAVYVFTWNGAAWGLQQKLTPSLGAAPAYFGHSLALEGDRLVVGASADGPASFQGAAYVFERAAGTWTETRVLTAGDAVTGDRFGFSVGLAGDWIAVGAARVGDRGAEAGAVYAFEWTGSDWAERAKLMPAGLGGGETFGWSLDLEGEQLLVGAPQAGAPPAPGQAFRYELVAGAWTERETLAPVDGEPGDLFGWSAAFANGAALVGAPGEDDAGADSGCAYVLRYRGGVWIHLYKLHGQHTELGDLVGYAVAHGGETIALGARDRGEVHVFGRPEPVGSANMLPGASQPCPCGNEDVSGGGGCANSTGRGALLYGSGTASVGSDDLVLRAMRLPAGELSLLIGSHAAGATLPFGAGISALLSSPTVRFGVKTTPAQGLPLEWGPGLRAYDPWLPGQHRVFQVWFRDGSGSPCGASLNTSNGYQVTFVP